MDGELGTKINHVGYCYFCISEVELKSKFTKNPIHHNRESHPAFENDVRASVLVPHRAKV